MTPPAWVIIIILAWWVAAIACAIVIGKSIVLGDKMARKIKHDQKALPDSGWKCTACVAGECNKCIDVIRVASGMHGLLCKCKRRGHNGEPTEKQLIDPETGTVWGPGSRITKDGEVLDGGLDN